MSEEKKYPEKVRLKYPMWGFDNPIMKLDWDSMTYFFRGPLGEYSEIQADILISNTDKFEPVTEYPATIDLEIKGITKRFRLETYEHKQYNLRGYFWDHGGPIPPEIMLNASRQRDPAKWTDADMVAFLKYASRSRKWDNEKILKDFKSIQP